MKTPDPQTVYVCQNLADPTNLTAYKNLTDLLQTLNIRHLYRTITYHLCRAGVFHYEDKKIIKTITKIETRRITDRISIITFNNQKIKVKHGRQS